MKKGLRFICIYFFFFASGLSLSGQGQEAKISFERLSLLEGLSHNNVPCMIQDRKGYMWFGTYDGLNRYDGYTFKVYNFDYKDTTSLAQNLILSLFEDSRGIIWAGTAGTGLCSFNPATEKFTRYPAKKDTPGALHVRTITAFNEDKGGNLWIGTTQGLCRLDPSTGTFTRYNILPAQPGNTGLDLVINSIYRDSFGALWIGTTGYGLIQFSLEGTEKGEMRRAHFIQYTHHPQRQESLGSNAVLATFEDQKGVLWVGTMKGLDKFDRKTGIFTHYRHDPANPLSISSNQINSRAIAEDKAGNLWIGTIAGLNRLNPDRTTFTAYFHQPDDESSISSSDVHSVLIDRTGALWAGTINGGVNRSNLRPKPFSRFSYNPANANSLSHSQVRAICEDRTGILWIGTEGGGLNRYDKHTNTFTHFRHDPAKPGSIQSNFVGAILEDRHGNLWVGCGGSNFYVHNGGLSKLDRKTNQFTHYPIHAADALDLSDTEVFSLYESRDGYLWISTENGIKRFDPRGGHIIHYLPTGVQSSGISDFWCYAISEDSRGNLWIGTGSHALNKLDRKTGKITHYSYNPSDPESISSHSVRQIYEDTKGRLWFATSGGGLCQFEPLAETFTAYTEREGLPSNSVHRIEEDDKGYLWLATNKGLCRFDPDTKNAVIFDYSDGLQGNQFASGYVNAGASFKGRDGMLYFGGSDGFNQFHPKDIDLNKHIPPVVITQFRLFDKPVAGMHEAAEITLNYDQNVFSFEFSALNFNNPHKNKYAYLLENFDDHWVHSGTRRYASYTNMDPGTYIFRVKGSNNDDIWNTSGTAIKITILPPWWQTWWAYAIYSALGILALIAMRQTIVARERLRNDLKLQRLESEKMHELNKMKSHFFANISHEFRTPLLLILGPLERFLAQTGDHEHTGQVYRMMYRNGQRLLQLITQLLDLSRLEAGQLSLDMKPGNLMLFLKNIVYSFNSLAERDTITFLSTFSADSLYLCFDADKLEKILVNLLSNAFKFTSTGGTVEVLVFLTQPYKDEEQAKQELTLQVSDTGIGVPEDQLEKIFDRFYQVDASHTREKEGSGLGLALTKELVALHGGTIEVESKQGKGTTFTICLSLPLAHHPQEGSNGDDMMHTDQPRVLVAEEEIEKLSDTPILAAQEMSPPKSPLLLLVEDNPDVRNYMCQLLSLQYRILEVGDGLEALNAAFGAIPDLIISDIMMPGMDGIELCRRLKTDERTSHIPIILLTARAGEESKLQGLETGADDYLTKPFNAQELHLRVKNLIEQRAKLRECFSRKITMQPQHIAITSTDEKFLQKVMAIMEANMADTAFDVEKFSKELGMSRAQLHRKLKALTDQSPSDLIRIIRLKRAASLLEGQSGNISEVAFSVGFNSLTYFTRAFRQYYGQTPSEYIHSHSIQES